MRHSLSGTRAHFYPDPGPVAWSVYMAVASDLGRLPSDDDIDAWLFAREHGYYPDETPTVDLSPGCEPDPEDSEWWAQEGRDDID